MARDITFLFPDRAAMLKALGAAGMLAGDDVILHYSHRWAFHFEDDPAVMAPFGGGVAGYLRVVDPSFRLPAIFAEYRVLPPIGDEIAKVPDHQWA